MKKKQLQIARSMLKASLKNGLLDRNKAKTVLVTLSSNKPQGLSSILKTYKRLVEAKYKLENLEITTAVKIANARKAEKNLLAKTGARKVTYKTNPEMIFGARITQGDWIWEETLESKLKQLATPDFAKQNLY